MMTERNKAEVRPTGAACADAAVNGDSTSEDAPKLARLIGLARRAGYLVRGEEPVRRALRAKRGRLIIIAEDTAEGTLRKILPEIRRQQVPRIPWSSKQSLGALCGWSETAYVLVTDPAMAEGLQKVSGSNVSEERSGAGLHV